jgi:hypothetical protein
MFHEAFEKTTFLSINRSEKVWNQEGGDKNLEGRKKNLEGEIEETLKTNLSSIMRSRRHSYFWVFSLFFSQNWPRPLPHQSPLLGQKHHSSLAFVLGSLNPEPTQTFSPSPDLPSHHHFPSFSPSTSIFHPDQIFLYFTISFFTITAQLAKTRIRPSSSSPHTTTPQIQPHFQPKLTTRQHSFLHQHSWLDTIEAQ